VIPEGALFDDMAGCWGQLAALVAPEAVPEGCALYDEQLKWVRQTTPLPSWPEPQQHFALALVHACLGYRIDKRTLSNSLNLNVRRQQVTLDQQRAACQWVMESFGPMSPPHGVY
jgi:hypothetical protein